MKTITLLFSIFILPCLSSYAQGYEKLKDSDATPAKIGIARKFAVDYLTAQRNGSYYEFKDEAVDIIKNSLTAENQKAGYKQLKDKFGDFKSLEYAETWIQKNNANLKVYRFKGNFDKSNRKLEIRVILNEKDKIAGFWIRPWSDML
jgi:hypothetical protein